jgi:hypothetical protein
MSSDDRARAKMAAERQTVELAKSGGKEVEVQSSAADDQAIEQERKRADEAIAEANRKVALANEAKIKAEEQMTKAKQEAELAEKARKEAEVALAEQQHNDTRSAQETPVSTDEEPSIVEQAPENPSAAEQELREAIKDLEKKLKDSLGKVQSDGLAGQDSSTSAPSSEAEIDGEQAALDDASQEKAFEECRTKLIAAQQLDLLYDLDWKKGRLPFVVVGPAFHDLPFDAREGLADTLNCFLMAGNQKSCINFDLLDHRTTQPVAYYKYCRLRSE